MSLYTGSSPQDRRPSTSLQRQQAKFLLSHSGESHSYSPPVTPVAGTDVAGCTLEVLHRALDFLLHPVYQQAKFLLSNSGGSESPTETPVAR